MKKSLIAGAGIVALGLAVVPFAGVFAADITTMTDTINVTVADVCTFDAASHSYTKAFTANKVDTIGATTMKVTCNNAKGYIVKGNFTDLTGPAKSSGNETITYGADAAVAAGDGKWNATVGSATSPLAKTSATVTSKTTMSAAGGDSTTITYKAGTTDNQAAGTYTGTATYTLSKNS